MDEIVALEQQRLVGGHGERVGEAVADIQPRLVAAAAEAAERVDGDLGLLRRDAASRADPPRRKRSRSSRSASALRIASVSVSPVRVATSRASRSVSLSFRLSAILFFRL
jgi:hypothetical protein